MEDEIKKLIYESYEITIKNLTILNGGWMNKKYLCEDNKNKKYVIKLFSSKKIEKMSKGEYSSNYLDNQLENNLRIENYMHSKQLNCEQIEVDKKNRILLPYGDYRIAVINFLNGNYVSREKISKTQLYNLGKECAKMHMLFKNTEQSLYIGKFLKIPSLDELFNRYEEKMRSYSCNMCQEYLDLLLEQGKCLHLLKKFNTINEIPLSLIHGDFADDNILFENNIPKILDFELVRLNSPLLDIGRITMSYCYDNFNLEYEKLKAFMLGYNNIYEIKDCNIFLAFITVWVNEVDMWIKEKYFNKEITKKSKRFQEELIYLTYNFSNIIQCYVDNKSLIDFCDEYNKKRRLLK